MCIFNTVSMIIYQYCNHTAVKEIHVLEYQYAFSLSWSPQTIVLIYFPYQNNHIIMVIKCIITCSLIPLSYRNGKCSELEHLLPIPVIQKNCIRSISNICIYSLARIFIIYHEIQGCQMWPNVGQIGTKWTNISY